MLLRATERKPDASLVEYGNYPSPFESGNLAGCYQRGRGQEGLQGGLAENAGPAARPFFGDFSDILRG